MTAPSSIQKYLFFFFFFTFCVYVRPDSFICVDRPGSTAAHSKQELPSRFSKPAYTCTCAANLEHSFPSGQCTVPAWQVSISFELFLEEKNCKTTITPRSCRAWGTFFCSSHYLLRFSPRKSGVLSSDKVSVCACLGQRRRITAPSPEQCDPSVHTTEASSSFPPRPPLVLGRSPSPFLQ